MTDEDREAYADEDWTPHSGFDCRDCSHYECCSADGFIGGCRPEFNETEEEE